MAFGGASGPPASPRQLSYLTSLLAEAGYDTFREARHAFGLTQRQAGGRFTKAEASRLIDVLVNGVEAPDPDAIDADDEMQTGLGLDDPLVERPPSKREAAATARAAKAEERMAAQREALVSGMPADLLVEELERRGWRCTPPPA